MSREEEEADIQSDMSDYDESQDNHQADLLALLNAQCAASLGASIAVPTPTASTSSRNILQDKEESDNEEQEEDDEWNGIDDEVSHTHVQVPISSSSSLGKTPQIVSFSDSNTLFGGKRRQREEEQDLDGTIGDQKDDFMSSKIRRVNTSSADEVNKKRKGKGKGRANDEDEVEEKHLKELDASLYSLIRELPSNANVDAAASSSLLTKLAESTANNPSKGPRLLTRKSQENEKQIDKKAPRILRERLYTARLERAKLQDSISKENGIVTAAGKGKYSLTKKARREEKGIEDLRRKNAKGITGVIGKMRKGGAVLSLNREEIRRANDGDLENITKRKHKGGPRNLGGKPTKGGGPRRR